MGRSTNNLEVKKLNRNRVFRFVNDRNETCMPEISAALDMSGPTVMTIVRELKEAGIFAEVGEFKSTGGRKAKAIASVKDAKYAVGLDITRNHIGIVYTDLTLKVLKHKRIKKPFENTEQYFRELSRIIQEFTVENSIPQEKIVGIGMAVPGIIDRNKKVITNSHALGVYGVACKEWEAYMPYPCEIINDANAAALAERIRCGEQGGMVYLSLSNTVGGAIIFPLTGEEAADDGEAGPVNMYLGNNWRGAEFGHMVIHPGGEKCYCGKEGCLDAYCSALKLTSLNEGDIDMFFEQLELGSQMHYQVWKKYLEDLAIAVDNLRMCFDCEVVLGGYVGSCMEPYMQEFRQMAAAKDIFDRDGGYVRACKYQNAATALGGAVFQMEKYIISI